MNLLLRKTEDRSKPNRRDFMIQTGCAGLGITSLVNTIAQLKMIGAAAAQPSTSEYKALVCVFLNGGNDSNNLLIPAGGASTARSEYTTGRGVLAVGDAQFDFTPTNAQNGYWNGSAVTQDAVSSRISPLNGGVGSSAYDPISRTGYTQNNMALHPGAYPLADLFQQERLGVMANVGTLVGTQNVTRGNFNTLPSSAKPAQLFSHSDQQVQWQSSLSDRAFTSGWGGRMADLLAGMNEGDLSFSVSIAGVNSFQVGISEKPYFMNASGSVSALNANFSGGSPNTSYGGALRNAALQPDYTNPVSLPAGKYNPLAPLGSGSDPLATTNYQNNSAGYRLRALEQVLAMSHSSLFDQTYVGVPQNARISEGLVGSALAETTAPNPTLDAHFDNWFPSNLFNPRIPDFANQMKTVARMIAGNSVLSNKRQIFFVQIGGWDTHASQIPSGSTTAGHYSLVNQLSRGMRAFHDAMQALGLWNNVCAFTASDFNRTFNPNKSDSTGGSDHAWGGHSLIMGGAVKGKNIYGRFPSLIKGGPTTNVGAQYIDCSGSSGRWIPSTSVDQYAATIAKWFGVSDANLSTVFPNLGRFMPNGLSNSELVAKNLDIFDYTI
jgi:uncharacterized protein (DUF1501 family)